MSQHVRSRARAGSGKEKKAEAEAEAKPELLVEQPAKKKWRNWCVRGALSLTMLGLFAAIVYMGPMALTIMVIVLQLKCFQEIITIGHYKWPKELPWFRSLSWYFLLAANYFFYGENFEYLLQEYFVGKPSATRILRYHRFISFCLYIVGFCTFVLSLQKQHMKFQFKQFAWTHIALLLIVTTSQLIIRSIYEGLMWFLLPSCLVICNDIMAYLFGFFFGRTPLIKLSPKKTWEGFLGAFGSTLVFSLVFANFLATRPFFYCPVESLTLYQLDDTDCQPPSYLTAQTYELPKQLHDIAHLLGHDEPTISIAPMYIHATVMAIFSSLIAPFGGFFASGLKRAFQIKDFDNLIPGHGGVTDRFDCQFVMAVFTYVYYKSFVNVQNVQLVLANLFALDLEHQQEVYQHLHRHLQNQGAMP